MSRLRELLILRHAKSDWKDPTLADIDRPLAGRGKKNAAKVGKWLEQQNLIPDLILCSPAKRAQQTLKRVCIECGAQTQTVDALYMANLDTLLKVLADAPDVDRLMIIGHNPGLERLFNYLNCQMDESTVTLFPTAALAQFILPADWHNLSCGAGKLSQFMRPKEILLKE
ncbi:MAG: histidine phosphatase family protein [Gammaproteobacteria bacterium]|nr:histidine phosphatase family protein [Gammaproteobacteria bacterium]MBD3776831.1 histidine phosphatase family protein [Thiotrichales bacterium]